jgi:hypothetical protein
MCAASIDEARVLLSQYEKTVDLYMHEDRLAWELVSIYIVAQVGLVSAVAALLVTSSEHSVGTLRYYFLFLAGTFSSLAFFFALWRSRMWRQNWYFAGLRIERQLAERRLIRDFSLISFGTFEIMRRSERDKCALELSDDEDLDLRKITYRKQRWRERIGALKILHWAMLAIAIVWLGLSFYSLYLRSLSATVASARLLS